jgi:hypothetical protein
MAEVLVLIPVYSHLAHQLAQALAHVGVPRNEIFGVSDLVRARSVLLSDALETDAQRFVFLDADVVPTPQDLHDLIHSSKVDQNNAVSGCYLSRPDQLAVQSAVDTVELFGDQRFVPMLWAGMGFASVHRAAVERVRASLPRVEGEDNTSWYPFFLPMVLEHPADEATVGFTEYLAEDLSFWWRLRQVGVSLWIDTHLVVGHAKASIWRPEEGEVGSNYTVSHRASDQARPGPSGLGSRESRVAHSERQGS